MNNRHDFLNNLIIKSLFFALFCIIGFSTIGISSIVSLCFKYTFIALFFLWVLNLSEYHSFTDHLAIAIIIISLFNILFNIIIDENTFVFNFTYFQTEIMFCCTIVYFSLCAKLKIDKSTKQFISWLMIILSFYLEIIFITKVGGSRVIIYDGDYVTFGMSNPNLACMFLFAVCGYLLATFIEEKRIQMKIISFILFVLMCYIIYKTGARNCIISGIFTIAIIVLSYVFKTRFNKISKPYILLISAFPILFAVTYMLLIDSSFFNTVFSFLIDKGKNLDSRVRIWGTAFDWFMQSPILGYYMHNHGNMHNTQVFILASYGIVVLALVIVYQYFLIVKVNDEIKNKNQKTNLLIFTGELLMGMGEASLFCGGLGLHILVGGFLLFANSEFNEAKLLKKEL